jgi:hypothetical protein
MNPLEAIDKLVCKPRVIETAEAIDPMVGGHGALR